MDDRRFDRDAELEHLLEEGLSAPPEEVLREVTPWRRAMRRILLGITLFTLTLNYWNLNYILPTAGYILILLGLRALRRENGPFRVLWYSHLLRFGLAAFCLLRQAAPGWQGLNQTLLGPAAALEPVQLLCLWLGLREVRRRAGLSPGAGSALALLVFKCVILCLALSGVTQVGWIFFFLMLALYVCILRALFRLSRELDEAGYDIRPAPVQVPDRVLALGLAGGLLAGIAVVSLTCTRLPMDWRPVDPSEHVGLEETEARLLELGFPAEVLADLARSDLRACAGALRVETEVRSFAMTNGWNDETPKPLTITGVAVEVPGERESWRVFHHFSWAEGTRFYGSEAFELWTLYDHMSQGWSELAGPTGRVLCDREGTACWAPYCSLETETYTTNSLFFGTQTSSDPLASFSFPLDGENCRGYVTYAAETVGEWILDSWINYVHQRSRCPYPAVTALEWQKAGTFNRDEQPFFRVQDAIQFYPFEWPE